MYILQPNYSKKNQYALRRIWIAVENRGRNMSIVIFYMSHMAANQINLIFIT